jgi:hypothetical protein
MSWSEPVNEEAEAARFDATGNESSMSIARHFTAPPSSTLMKFSTKGPVGIVGVGMESTMTRFVLYTLMRCFRIQPPSDRNQSSRQPSSRLWLLPWHVPPLS